MSLIPTLGLGRGFLDDSWDIDPFGLMEGSSLMPRDRRIEGATRTWAPRLDMTENDKAFKVSCDLPGLTKENSSIDVDEENRQLTISGKREEEQRQENEQYHIVERGYGDFKRTISLPRNVNMDGIKAKMENGILNVTIPKVPSKKKRKRLPIE